MSGVRNLRAMFEQKGDSLPDRGRSPGPGGFGSDSPSASPRPLSKVRTSFVAVEKDGRIGLRREPSEDSVSVSSRRKFSNDTDTTSERPDIFSDRMTSTGPSFKTNLSHEAIPESPRQDEPVKTSPQKEFKSPRLGHNANPDKITDEEEPQTKMLSGNPTDSSAARLGGTVFDDGASNILNGTVRPAADGSASNTTKAKAANSLAKSAPKTTAPISTAKTTSKPSKSPLTTKFPNGKEAVKPGSSSAATKRAAATTTATKTAAAKPAPANLAPASTGFVKPKPKSPTRPVKLPSNLTTHTASSAQKYGSGSTAQAPRQSLSRASGNAQHLAVDAPTHRSPSRNSVSTVGTTTTTTKTLKHKPSTLGRSSRPSLGLPPKQESKSQPTAKRESQVNEDFLARMMRPTQSSAKKTSDKAPVTPPRKQAAPVRKPDPKDTEKTAKKVAARIQGSSVKAKAAKEEVKSVAVKEQPTAKEIAPAVSQAETAEAAIESAKLSTETAEIPLVEDEKSEVEPSANEVAAVVAQEETAEAIVETAKTSTDTADLVDVPSTDGPGDVEAEAEPSHEPSTELEAVPKSYAEAESVPEPSSEVESVPEPSTEVETTPEAIPEAETTPQPTAEVEAVPEPSVEVDTDEPIEYVPVVSEDPLKVEDIEDIVKGTEQLSLQHESTNGHGSVNGTAKVSGPEEVPETDAATATPVEEPQSDTQEAVDEAVKEKETPAETKKASDKELEKENPAVVDVTPSDTTTDDGAKIVTDSAIEASSP
ncbi:hypothetical protein NPX13_g8113 [Xylaria arbuscula]|uniref:Uncharacterized protein n=1 Tax=Xylaria arbuscula TaxID=114810 RepID=A0A9W8N8T0_9PEZI|nr:hypothetical protein NPX13_g8113 [Xylaria arbuscula]